MKHAIELEEKITTQTTFTLGESSREVDWRRKYEELERCLNRIKKFYDGKIISETEEDSLQSPKDFARNFFRVSYELKEALKHEPVTEVSRQTVEQFCSNNLWAGLGIDIANQTKHGWWNIIPKRRKTDKKIGQINTSVHLMSPDKKNRTELTIDIDGKKENCLDLAQKTFDAWVDFLQLKNLINKRDV